MLIAVFYTPSMNKDRKKIHTEIQDFQIRELEIEENLEPCFNPLNISIEQALYQTA